MKGYKGRQGVLYLDEELAQNMPKGLEAKDYTSRFMDGMLDMILSHGLRNSVEGRMIKEGTPESRFYAMLVSKTSMYATPQGGSCDLAIPEKDGEETKLRYVGEWLKLMGPKFGAAILSVPNPKRMLYAPKHSILVMHDNRPDRNEVIITYPAYDQIEITRKIAV